MPHGSVLGPILFVLYSVDLIQMVESHGLSPHLYADDVQVYKSVCLSVTRVDYDKTVETSVQIYIPYERTFILVF